MGIELQGGAEDVARSRKEAERLPVAGFLQIGLRRRGNAVELLRFDPLDDRSVRIDDHGKRKAEEDGAGIHEFPEEVAIGVEKNLGAVEVGRHQLRFAGQRPALQFPVGPRDGDRVVHELLERAREPGIEAALEGDGRDRRHEDGRQDRHQAEQPDDSHVETGRCRPCPALAHQLPGLPGDDPEKQGDQQPVHQEHPHHNVMGGQHGRCAGEDQEGRKGGGERRQHGSVPEPAEAALGRLHRLPLSNGVLVDQD